MVCVILISCGSGCRTPAGPTSHKIGGTIGGTVNGLVGTVSLNGGSAGTITLAANGSFVFPSTLPSGETYSIKVASQPVNQSCLITNGTGSVGSGNVWNLVINCGRSIQSVMTPTSFTCALDSSGRLKCWGDNQWGQISVPTDFSTNIVSFSAGHNHVCAINSSHDLKCWGTSDYNMSTVVDSVVHNISAVASGQAFTCVIQNTDGQTALKCWGFPSSADMGYQYSLNPQTIGQPGSKTVAAGWYHYCAIDANDTPFCGGYLNSDLPTLGLVPDGIMSSLRQNTLAISAGQWHTCAISKTHNLFCWGDGGSSHDFGQANVPEAFRTDIASVSAVDSDTCAIKLSGELGCWGRSYASSNTSRIAVPTGLSTGTFSVSAGKHSCAFNSSGNLICWGDNTNNMSTIPD